MSPLGNSMTPSSGISMDPNRVLSMFTGIEPPWFLDENALPEEIQERVLNDVRPGLQGGLVDGLLEREVGEGLGHVGVLDLREVVGGRLLELEQALGRGLQAVRRRADRGADRRDVVEVAIQVLEVRAAQ